MTRGSTPQKQVLPLVVLLASCTPFLRPGAQLVTCATATVMGLAKLSQAALIVGRSSVNPIADGLNLSRQQARPSLGHFARSNLFHQIAVDGVTRFNDRAVHRASHHVGVGLQDQPLFGSFAPMALHTTPFKNGQHILSETCPSRRSQRRGDRGCLCRHRRRLGSGCGRWLRSRRGYLDLGRLGRCHGRCITRRWRGCMSRRNRRGACLRKRRGMGRRQGERVCRGCYGGRGCWPGRERPLRLRCSHPQVARPPAAPQDTNQDNQSQLAQHLAQGRPDDGLPAWSRGTGFPV